MSFDQAKYVFADRHRVELYDAVHSTYDEDRYITIGLVEEVLFVVYTERGETMRLISARFANEKERRFYYGNR